MRDVANYSYRPQLNRRATMEPDAEQSPQPTELTSPDRMSAPSDTAWTLPAAPAPLASGAPSLSVIVPFYNEHPNMAPIIARRDEGLAGMAWEVIYRDDDSPRRHRRRLRRIAQIDPRVHCIRRIGRRGLASAVIEGAPVSSTAFVAVIDGNMQHDETR